MRAVSLFSGIGGFEEGFNMANLNYDIVFASEIDKYARLAYQANFTANKLVGDIKEIDEYDIPDHDLLIAGFPCQSFSIAGNRKGFDDVRGTLFFDILRVLRAKTPKYFLLENVKNLISHDKGNTIRTILQNLSSIGYSIDFSVLNSRDSGVPQNRERTYIIGNFNYKKEKFNLPISDKVISNIKNWCNKENLNTYNFFENISQDNSECKLLRDVILDDTEDKYFFDSDKIEKFLNEVEFQVNLPTNSINKIFDIPQDVHNDLQRQRRVYSVDGISPTILARNDSPKLLVETDDGYKIRKTTPIENFRIQGFSEDSIENIKSLNLSDTQLYKQSGNAVSPPVIRDIVNSFKNEKKISYKLSQNQSTFRFIDLFSGIGGFRIAMESLGGDCVFSSEIDKYAIETYRKNFNERPSGDIEKINENDIPDHDLLCAGFPCQPFSIGGLRKGFNDTRGTLFFDVARIVKAKKPKVVFLENVSGIKSHDKGRTIKVIRRTLEDLGYFYYSKVMNAKDYGIPQNRNRWYCVAIRRDIDSASFEFPEKADLNFYVKDIISDEIDDTYRISELAMTNINKYLDDFLISDRYQDDQILLASEVRKSRCNFRSDGISPCLTAKMGTGGNNVPIIVSQSRRLTERECLDLMGFPSWFEIEPYKLQSYKQIGNSVVVPLVRDIGVEIVKQFR